MSPGRLPPSLWLALAELWQERLPSLCTALGMTAVLAPLLVLAGLRAGVIEDLRRHLLDDPHAREIVTVSNRGYTAVDLARITALPHAVFLAPRTRTLAATLLVWPAAASDLKLRIELLPSPPNDPLLQAAPAATDAIVLSRSAAERLGVAPGAALGAGLSRIAGSGRKSASFGLRVTGVASAAAFERDGGFVTPGLASLLERFQNGEGDLPTSLAGLQPALLPRFAGFRLYADRIDSVPALDAALRRQQIDVVSKAGEIDSLMMIDRNLRALYAIIAGLGGTGYLLSLAIGIWANAERKRRNFALLRLLGLSGGALHGMMLTQTLLLTLAGATGGVLLALLAGAVINVHGWAGAANTQRICVISGGLMAAAMVASVAGGAFVATIAAWRVRAIEPWEGLSQS